MVDSNQVYHHNYGYLVQLQLCCRGYTPKMGYVLFLTGEVGGTMLSNHSFSYFIYFSRVWYLGFSNLDMKILTRNYPSGRTGYGLLHCSNPKNCWNKYFVITQCINEVLLHLWMAWCSFPQILVQETSFTDFIWRGKVNNWPFWQVFLHCHSLINCSILPFLLFFPVCDVA